MDIKARKNAGFPGLNPDAPQVPEGLRPAEGVIYGCGDPSCRDCYEPDPRHPATTTIDQLTSEIRAISGRTDP